MYKSGFEFHTVIIKEKLQINAIFIESHPKLFSTALHQGTIETNPPKENDKQLINYVLMSN